MKFKIKADFFGDASHLDYYIKELKDKLYDLEKTISRLDYNAENMSDDAFMNLEKDTQEYLSKITNMLSEVEAMNKKLNSYN